MLSDYRAARGLIFKYLTANFKTNNIGRAYWGVIQGQDSTSSHCTTIEAHSKVVIKNI